MADDFIPDDDFVPDTAQQVGQDFSNALAAAHAGLNPYSATPPKSWGQTALDVAKQIPSGLAEGAAGIATLPVAAMAYTGRGIEKGMDLLPENVQQKLNLGSKAERDLEWEKSQGLRSKIFDPLGPYLPAPETTAGRYANTIGQFAPAALVGPASLTRRVLTQAVAPAVASEAAGEATEGTPYEPAARIGAALATGMPLTSWRGKPPVPQAPVAPFGVTLSKGEQLSDEAQIAREQARLRIPDDPRLLAWKNQRAEQIAEANKNIAQDFNITGQMLAETPQEAGSLLSEDVQRAAKTSKAAVTAAYAQARGMPGEIHPSVFSSMGDSIKADLSNAADPVVIDDKLTPFASRMVDDLDNRISQLQIQNRASPYGQPNQQDIAGVNLSGVDQMRKRLSAFRRDAYASGNGADGRAARAVLDSFDDHIDQAVNGGMFKGDPQAISAWNNARAANADYRSTFTSGKNDPVGRVVQKIIGDNINDPLTASKVMDQLVGSSKINPSALNIGVAKRLKDVVGEQSPTWIAAKQGIYKGLVSTGEGEADYGTAQMAQRLSKFLNSDMAPVIYSAGEQQTLRSWANFLRQITPKPGAYSPSGPAINTVGATIRSRIGSIIGAVLARQVVPAGPWGIAAELSGLAIGARAERALERWHFNFAKQLPLIGEQTQQYQKALAKAASYSDPLPPAVARGTMAAANSLTQSLERIGIRPSTLQFPGSAGANEEPPSQQPDIPGPPTQQQRGGRVNQQHYAAGGSVKTHQGKPLVHPRVPNARLAHDGHYYAHDPERPGKFLKVVEASGRAEGGVAPAVDSDIQEWESLPKDASGHPIVSVAPNPDAFDPAMLMPMPKYTPPIRPVPDEPHNEWGDTLPASKGEAVGEGLAQGATAGWSHQLRAAQKASGVPDWMPGQLPVGAARLAWEHLTGQSDGPASTAYNDALLKIQNRAAKIREDHPYLEQGAEWVGAAASMGIVAPEVGMFPPLAAGVKLGAGYGGLYGASQKAEEVGLLTDPIEVAKAAGKGAVIGGTTGALTGSVAAGPAARAAVGAMLGAGYGAKKGYDKEGWAGVPKSAIEYGAAGALALPAAGYVGENAVRSLGQKAGVLPFRVIKTPGEPAPPAPSPSKALLPDVTPEAAPPEAVASPTIAGSTSNLPSLVDAIKQRFEVPDDVAQGIRSQLLANPDLQTIRIPGKASLPWPVSRFGGQLPVGQNLRDLARYEASQPAVRLAQQAEARYSAGANLDQKVRDIIGMHNLPPDVAPAIRSQILSDPARTSINIGAHTFDIGPISIGMGPHQANIAAPPSWTLSFGGKDVNLARAQAAAKDVNTGTAAARAGLFPAAPMRGAPAVESAPSNIIPLPLKTPAAIERSPAQTITDRWSKPEPYDNALDLARSLPMATRGGRYVEAVPEPPFNYNDAMATLDGEIAALSKPLSPAHTVADRWIQPSPDLPLALQRAAEEVRASAQRPYDFPAQYRVPQIERSANHRLFPRDDLPVVTLTPKSPAQTVADRWIQPRTVAGLVP